jgi:cytochrome oxidase assembly protein ShyY1
MSPETEIQLPVEESTSIEKAGSTAIRLITWFSVGVAVAVVGIFVGAELRSRSRFKKRTPYDFYANAGEQQASEFGVGV